VATTGQIEELGESVLRRLNDILGLGRQPRQQRLSQNLRSALANALPSVVPDMSHAPQAFAFKFTEMVDMAYNDYEARIQAADSSLIPLVGRKYYHGNFGVRHDGRLRRHDDWTAKSENRVSLRTILESAERARTEHRPVYTCIPVSKEYFFGGLPLINPRGQTVYLPWRIIGPYRNFEPYEADMMLPKTHDAMFGIYFTTRPNDTLCGEFSSKGVFAAKQHYEKESARAVQNGYTEAELHALRDDRLARQRRNLPPRDGGLAAPTDLNQP
jgi:hypothetical protein